MKKIVIIFPFDTKNADSYNSTKSLHGKVRFAKKVFINILILFEIKYDLKKQKLEQLTVINQSGQSRFNAQ